MKQIKLLILLAFVLLNGNFARAGDPSSPVPTITAPYVSSMLSSAVALLNKIPLSMNEMFFWGSTAITTGNFAFLMTDLFKYSQFSEAKAALACPLGDTGERCRRELVYVAQNNIRDTLIQTIITAIPLPAAFFGIATKRTLPFSTAILPGNIVANFIAGSIAVSHSQCDELCLSKVVEDKREEVDELLGARFITLHLGYAGSLGVVALYACGFLFSKVLPDICRNSNCAPMQLFVDAHPPI